MKHINGSYTTYFNVRHKRAGHLFQGLGSEEKAEEANGKTKIVKSVGLTPNEALGLTPNEAFKVLGLRPPRSKKQKKHTPDSRSESCRALQNRDPVVNL
jgi:hypothetical protein